MYQEDVDRMALDIHNWFINNPLGITEEGFDHFKELFESLVDQFSTGDYRNYN